MHFRSACFTLDRSAVAPSCTYANLLTIPIRIIKIVATSGFLTALECTRRPSNAFECIMDNSFINCRRWTKNTQCSHIKCKTKYRVHRQARGVTTCLYHYFMPNSHRLSQWGHYCREVGLNILCRQWLYCTHGNTIFNTFRLQIISTIYKIMRGVRTPLELIIYCKICTSEYSKWLLPAAFWQL